MRKLYTAADLLEAQLLKLMLCERGLSPVIKNESLQSGLGELPMVELWPEVWVRETRHWQAAVEVLHEFQQRDTQGQWVCECGESNPCSFESCWSCAESRVLSPGD